MLIAILLAVFVYMQKHYSNVIMDTMASQITSTTIVCLTIYSAEIKENIKAPRH